MNKQCPHCQVEVTTAEYAKFAKEQFGDWMLCSGCGEKYYIVLPENKRIALFLLTALSTVLFTVIIVGVIYFVVSIGENFLSEKDVSDEASQRRQFHVFIYGIGGAVAAIYLSMNFTMRSLKWKLSNAQKSPFV